LVTRRSRLKIALAPYRFERREPRADDVVIEYSTVAYVTRIYIKSAMTGVIGIYPMERKAVAGSVIGGIAETQELLDFCGKHGITSDVEVVKIQDINEAYERILKSDVKYRFVIGMASLKA
jgi:D-arabinose 1-dehydrogenase-like Zn-dependent alcohol dehydrogenase